MKPSNNNNLKLDEEIIRNFPKNTSDGLRYSLSQIDALGFKFIINTREVQQNDSEI